MATDDVQRLVTGTASTPAHFTIPGNGQIRPKAIFASVDGTGAATAFLPAIKVISDGGETVGIYPTQTSVAAGGSADVSWFPGVGVTGSGNIPPIPGTILGTYFGLSPAADFTTNSNAFVQTNFPTNTTFTKVSATSYLMLLGEADFTSGVSPDVLYFSVFIDGLETEGTGIHISNAGAFATATMSTVINAPKLPFTNAGPHTIDVRTACNSGQNFTMRTHTAVDLTVIEFVP